jgi:hypothetical protein
MKIRPFEAVGKVEFGMNRDAIINAFGAAVRESLSRRGETELHYANACCRFDSSSKLVEVTTNAPVVEFGSVAVPFNALASYVKQQDAAASEKVGFIVSPEFGVAFDPNFSSWVTAFSRERLQLWQAI